LKSTTSTLSKISFLLICIIIVVFGYTKTMVLFEYWESTWGTRWTEATCFICFIPLFSVMIKEYIGKLRAIKETNRYLFELNGTIISQSHNPLFYNGDLINGAKELTLEVTRSIKTDRCSIWLYNDDKTSIVCQQLYVASEDKWYDKIELFKKDFCPYFDALGVNPIIIADDAASHPATSCFTESYLNPLGIKSMLDVPIIYKGEIIGVICIENLKPRKWKDSEVNFAQNLSSLYSFAYSVSDNNIIGKELLELEKFVDQTSIVSKADKSGKITYVNKKFEKISGWEKDQLIGKDHSIVNSGAHTRSFWSNMYKKVIKGDVWNAIVTNKAKDGTLYHVDTYIKGVFDQETKEFKGFLSIRNDVTEVINTLNEIEKKNVYLEHAAKILRHDMHSGINTYIPRGISSLERRLNDDIIKDLKLEAPLKMLKEGLTHTQKVYRGVYEFTNLVKKDSVLEKSPYNLREILYKFLSTTAYEKQIALSDWLPVVEVNESLFCTAVDNLIRNGLKYNDSEFKMVAVFMDDENHLAIQDNGRGMSQKDFDELAKPYARKKDQKESGSGLGLNICIAILKEHGFDITSEIMSEGGTKIRIKIK